MTNALNLSPASLDSSSLFIYILQNSNRSSQWPLISRFPHYESTEYDMTFKTSRLSRSLLFNAISGNAKRIESSFLPSCLALLFFFLSGSAVAQVHSTISSYISDPLTRKSYHAYDESYALVVGIDRYTQVEARTSAASSAKHVAELLLSRFGFRAENVILLTDDQAKRSVIMDGLKKLQQRGPDDRLLIYLSGRGYTARDQSGSEYGAFVPYDGDVQTPDGALRTCIQLDDLKQSISTNSAKQTLVLLDFTVGGLPVLKQFNGAPPPRLGFQRVVTLPSKELIAAGARIETLSDDPATGMSYFSSKLIEALSSGVTDVNGDGIITGTELATRTFVRVNEATDRTLHPQFGFIDGGEGDFLFVVPRPADTSRVMFHVTPPDASVFVDDQPVKPGLKEIPVLAPKVGLHTIQVQRAGYHPIKDEFFVDGRVTVRADVELEKIPTMSLLVRVSQPDARVFVDGKLIGMPDETLIIDPIEKGTHTVRAELDGYFPDSATVTITDPIQYKVALHMTSRNGYLTIKSSEAVVIEVNGKVLGTRQIVKKEVVSGEYSVRLSGIGYSTYERTIVVRDSQSVVFDHPMSRPTLTGALIRSIVFPGWGQWYSGRQGIFYCGIFLILAGSSAELQLMYAKTNSDYKKAAIAFRASPTLVASKKASSLLKKRDNENLYRFGAFGVTGGFYLLNIINVWSHDPADLIREQEEQMRKEKTRTNVSLGFNEFGPALSLSIHF